MFLSFLPQNSMENADHHAATSILKATSGNVKLLVKRRCRRVLLVSGGEKYGLGLRGGAEHHSPVVISRISVGSPASTAPEIEVGGRDHRPWLRRRERCWR